MFTIYANKNGLDVREREPMTSGSVKVYKAHFEFSSYWDGFDRIAVFSAGDVRIDIALPEDNTCYVPWEVLETPGRQIIVGVYGMRENQVLPTLWGIIGTVEQGVIRGDGGIPEPTPELYEQLMNELRQKGDELRLAVETRSASYKLQLLSDGAPISEVSLLLPTAGDEGTFDHGMLRNRDQPNQHPISAITGLTDKIAEIEDGNANTDRVINNLLTNQENFESRLSVLDSTITEHSSKLQTLDLKLLEKATSIELNGEGQLVLKAGNTVLSTVEIPMGEGAMNIVASDVPVGTIVIWSGTTSDIPTGWQLCDGTNGTPDLRDKFVLGAGENYPVGDTGGAEEVTLTVEQMPTHSHSYRRPTMDVPAGTSETVIAYEHASTVMTTDSAGGSQPHPNMPPYYSLCYIMKITVDETDGLSAGEGVIIEDGIISLETPVNPVMTQAEYDALPEEMRNHGLYVIPDVGTPIKGLEVEEYDTEDGWHVIKWSNGYVEMFYSGSREIDSNTWANLGEFGLMAARLIPSYIVYPTPLTKKFQEVCSISYGNWTGLIMMNGMNFTESQALSHTSVYSIVRWDRPGPTVTIPYMISVRGLWK